ncbi:hypothetical protein Tco_0625810, partial [Tanacetum coccineum]
MMVQAQEEMGEGLANPTDPHHTPTITQPSTSQPQKKQPRRKQRKDTEVSQPGGPTEPMADETENVESVPTHSNDPLLSGEDSLKLNELMELCTNLQKKVLDLETIKTIQALEIDSLKRRVKKLKKKQKSRTHKLRRLYKGRKILDIDADEDITLDSTHVDTDPDMFEVHDLHGDEVFVEIEEPVVNAATTTTTTATTTIADEVEITLAQTLIEIKSAKPKAKGIVMQDPSESTPTIYSQQPSQVKGQGSKDKVKLEEEEEERLARQKEEEANIALIESWDNTQAMMDDDRLLAERLQAREQEELTDKEKARLFLELLEKRKKHFAALRSQEKRNKPPTKAPKEKYNKLFDKAIIRVNMFVDMDTKLVRESSKKDEAEIEQESSSKRAGDELDQEKAKKQKIDDDQEEAKLKELMEVIFDEE